MRAPSEYLRSTLVPSASSKAWYGVILLVSVNSCATTMPEEFFCETQSGNQLQFPSSERKCIVIVLQQHNAFRASLSDKLSMLWEINCARVECLDL